MTAEESQPKAKKSLIINAFVMMCSGHQATGLWKHPDDQSHRFYEIDHWVVFPQSFKDIIDLLLPELRKRGLFWDDYAAPGGTNWENLYGKPGQKYPLDEHVVEK